MTGGDRPVVVWGNCQAEPVASLLREPLAAHGLTVARVPPVFEIDEPGLARVRELVSRAALLITQPVRDEYRLPGCGADQLAAGLPAGARVLRFPVTYHGGTFPYQVNAHTGDGARIAAPLTDYHDLRALVAAERGLDDDEALAWWPAPAAEAVRDVAAASVRELQRREARLDVRTSDLVDAPHAMFTISHPANALLAVLAERILTELGLPGPVAVGDREFLGARRAPVEAAVLAARGWPTAAERPDWLIDGRTVARAEMLRAHLRLYRERPDVVADARTRFADRLTVLGL